MYLAILKFKKYKNLLIDTGLDENWMKRFVN